MAKEKENHKNETELKNRLKYEKCIEYYAKKDANTAIIEFNNFMKQKRLEKNGQNIVVRQNEYDDFSNNLGS